MFFTLCLGLEMSSSKKARHYFFYQAWSVSWQIVCQIECAFNEKNLWGIVEWIAYVSSTNKKGQFLTIKIRYLSVVNNSIVWSPAAHRLENRCVLRHISNMNFLYWAVLSSRGCREKKSKLPYVCKFCGQFFYVLMGKKNTLGSALKSYMI